MKSTHSTQAIRQHMRAKRANLSVATLAKHEALLAEQFVTTEIFRKANIIASFLAVNGEQSPARINQSAQVLGKQVLLPIVQNFSAKLRFGPLEAPRIYNKFNIAEPSQTSRIPAWRFDVVLLPLTAFDHRGHRIGMGGGYYDQTFAFSRFCSQKPLLIGIAHAFQKTARIKPQPWDVPLDGILTESEFTLF